MGRKNSRVGTRRTRREYRGAGVRNPDRGIPRIPVERSIIPDGRCPGRRAKARFATKEKAEAALAQAKLNRERIGSPWVEKRVYRCPMPQCGGWHLSSREAFDEGQATRLHEQRNQED